MRAWRKSMGLDTQEASDRVASWVHDHPDHIAPKERLPSVDSVCHVFSERARVCDHAHRALTGKGEAAVLPAKMGAPVASDVELGDRE